ncbi:hypothetical protein CLAFUW4_03165 [Fulvia fulva]|uniref:Uncharacterized protein n=1 Tax=Passalora fulva TaxID=5499 RepID=A0A9Q8LDA8_PASFU|nr:uncharacterized protein CLAFUR5_03149 [Fulvia fulva]KAK4630861.1 hypothetical protein CLAFUR4_03154 [Fulvia fulva]KAK4632478.1 hypothetical protein CLAFUR0_03159 [Fulvia fulva]UJO14588.1 hypothetical protein CLAFUR5_03149 [Fulvia fulva]WPV11426.1 hypothetical protein CLAFUW4_03165 [Fulvia fulva]WPV26148.1 hypothetical protein CLAFUW7_03158 [Fulvia fulva]
MRYHTSTFALLALPATVLAVSLADFKPRVSDLPSKCQTVYTETIDGCSPTDFTASTCSTGCVKALQALVADVKSACGNEDISGENVIAAFLNNAGPQGLCTNANAVLGSGSTTTSPASSSKPSPSSSATPTSSRQASSTSSEVTTSTAASSTKTATSLESATSTPSSSIATDPSSSPTATPTQAASHSSSNGNSGGGSPFDTEGNMHSAATAIENTVAMMLLAVLVALAGALR